MSIKIDIPFFLLIWEKLSGALLKWMIIVSLESSPWWLS